jgi:hypothetical protein
LQRCRQFKFFDDGANYGKAFNEKANFKCNRTSSALLGAATAASRVSLSVCQRRRRRRRQRLHASVVNVDNKQSIIVGFNGGNSPLQIEKKEKKKEKKEIVLGRIR